MGDHLTQKDIFIQCQTGLQGHGKLIKSLNKIYKKTDHSAFQAEFFHYLRYPMIVFKREPAVERMIDFVAKFLPSVCTPDKKGEEEKGEEEDEEDPDILATNKLLQGTFDFLLQYHSARDRAVRFRCCQLINKLLANLGEEAQIDDELYDRLYECMLDRLKDKCPVVRYHAVLAMARLQDPGDENCPVIKAYLFLLNCDPNADVRRSVLSSIAPSTKTLPSIVGRTRDVKDTVRKTAYVVLSEKIHVKALSIALRLQLLNEGLNDRSELVKQTCSGKLLQAWMRTFEGNVLKLLKSLDVEDSTEICCTVLETLFKGLSLADIVDDFKLLGERLLIPEEELTSESVFYWQMVCKYLHKLGNDGDEYLEKVLPNCVDFCGYVSKYVEGLKTVEDPEDQLGREFIIEQLLLMASYMDTADSASRKSLETLLHNMVIVDHVSHRLVKPLVLRICELRGDGENLVNYFAEVVSEIREPITVVEKDIAEELKRQLNLKIASIRVKLNQFREDLDEYVKSQDFERAAVTKGVIAELDAEKAALLAESEPTRQETRTERNDPLTIQKCQTIISEMLQNLKLTSVNPTLQMMIESQIVPGIQNEDADVRNMAMQALGLCCYLSKDLLVTYIPLFMQASQIDTELVRVTALRVLFDLLLIYGLEVIDSTETASSSSGEGASAGEENADAVALDEKNQAESSSGIASKLVAIICSFLDVESSELRTCAGEGLSKLLLSCRVVSPKILSHLILLWYNPLSEDDTHLRDCLGTFFPLFALASRANQEIVEEAFLPTLKTLLNAPTTSPLAEVNVNNVAELLVPLTNSTLLSQNQNATERSHDNPGHDNLSEKVCNEVLSDPTSPNVKLWITILNQMEVSPDNEMVLKDLRILCHKMMKTVKDKLCVKSLSKFQKNIDELASKFVTNDDDLENIEIDSVQQEEEEEAQEESTIQTPKRKRVRGLYSQNITLESDVVDLDLTQDVSTDIDASCLMRQASTVSDTPSKRSRKNTTEVAAEDDDIFLKPDAPAQKRAKSVEGRGKDNDDKNKESTGTVTDDDGEDNEEVFKVPEKRKSDVARTTPEKRSRVDNVSPEKRRSRSREPKQKSPTKQADNTTGETSGTPSPTKRLSRASAKPAKDSTSEKTPARENQKAIAKSPTKPSGGKSPTKDAKMGKSRSPTKAGSTKSTQSPSKNAPNKDVSKSPSKSASKSPEKRSSSKRKASQSTERTPLQSPERAKRQRSTDISAKQPLKRKASPGKRNSTSPEKKQRSVSRDNPVRGGPRSLSQDASHGKQQKKSVSQLSKAPVGKATVTHGRDVNRKQVGGNVGQMSSRNADPASKPRRLDSKNQSSNGKQDDKNKKEPVRGMSSPRQTRGSNASIVVDTPESRSRKSPASKSSTPSIAETPDTDQSSGSRRSIRGKNTPRSAETPATAPRSTRSLRGTPSSVESDFTPKLLTRSARNVAQTPNGDSPEVFTRQTRSVLNTPNVQTPKDASMKKRNEEKRSGKEAAKTGKAPTSQSSSGSSSESQTAMRASSRSNTRQQEESDSGSPITARAKTAKGKPQRSVPAKESERNAASTTDDDEEETQIRRRVKSSRKSTGSKPTGAHQSVSEKSTASPGTRSSMRETTASKPSSQSSTQSARSKTRNTAQAAGQKKQAVASTAQPSKPSTPRSQKSDSDTDGVLSSPGSARSTRSAKLTEVTRGTHASNAKVLDKRPALRRAPTSSSQLKTTAKGKPLPRWK